MRDQRVEWLLMAQPNRVPVFVVDDDRDTRALLVRDLQRGGMEVHAFGRASDALAALRDRTSALVLADWNMPDMDGLELCRSVQEMRKLGMLHSSYFIMLTAQDDRTEVARAIDAGADDYITKPWHSAELRSRTRAGERLLCLQQENWLQRLDLAHKNAELELLAERLERVSRTDELTGICNRRYLMETLSSAWSLSIRSGRPLSCILFDIDRFKTVNDQYGHRAGDGVLQDTARRARQHIRTYDALGRWGGEEFLVICPETDRRDAGAIAERLRLAISETAMIADGRPLSISISVGVAQRGDQHNSPEELVQTADAMMYRAKSCGRNQTWMAVDHDQAECLTPGAAGCAG